MPAPPSRAEPEQEPKTAPFGTPEEARCLALLEQIQRFAARHVCVPPPALGWFGVFGVGT